MARYRIPEGPAEGDGLSTRPANNGTIDKLAIVRKYLQGFATACSNHRPFYFIDGFAGPGLDRVEQTGELLWGSPLIAAQARPSFERILAVDLDQDMVEALAQRSAAFGSVLVRQGDANRDLLGLMGEHIPATRPATCLLDPAGMNLHWATVEAVARFRRHPTNRTEVLVLFPTSMNLWRMFPSDGRPPTAVEKIDRLYGSDEWHQVWSMWRDSPGATPGKLKSDLLDLYAQQFERLGYRTVATRQVRLGGQHGVPLYDLIFASTNDAGASIGTHVLANTYRTKRQGQLFDP